MASRPVRRGSESDPSPNGHNGFQGRLRPAATGAFGEGIRLEHTDHEENITCPACHSRLVGRLGNSQYYCWDCCVQFNRTDRGVQTFHIDEDGTLVAGAGGEEGPHGGVHPAGHPTAHHTTDQGGHWR